MATAPKMVRLVIFYLRAQLEELTRRISSASPCRSPHEEFRTDAKCERNLVVLAGHHLESGRWFSVQVVPSQAPYLFDNQGESSWASASAELLASLAALQVFGYLEDVGNRRVVPIMVAAGTDNQSNEALSNKRASTAWPLMLVNMQLSHHLFRASLQLSLRWRPRDENQLADDLTNSRFEGVVAERRIVIRFEDLELGLLNRLWAAREDFMDRSSLKTWPVQSGGQTSIQVNAKW